MSSDRISLATAKKSNAMATLFRQSLLELGMSNRLIGEMHLVIGLQALDLFIGDPDTEDEDACQREFEDILKLLRERKCTTN